MSREYALSWQAALVLPFAAGFFGATLSFVVSSANEGEKPVTAAIAAAPVGTDTGAATSTLDEPAYLIIPAIGVNAVVQSIGLSKTGNGDIGIPSNFTDAAWYNRGPMPGSPGIAIIDGHLDGRYIQEAVFYHLGDLTAGESIYVKDRSGVLRRFVVIGNERLPYDADTRMLFVNSGMPRLVLITCAGDWLPDKHEYTDRILVSATLAS